MSEDETQTDPKAPLSDKQRRFVEEYLIDHNATQAATRAGYSERTAQEQGSRLLSNVMVSEAVRKAQEARSARTEITADRVLVELAKIGFSNMSDYMKVGANGDPFLDFSQITRDQAAAIQDVTVEDFKDGRGEDARDVRRVKFKLADKRAALVDIGKHLGMFVDRGEMKMSADVSFASVMEQIAANGRKIYDKGPSRADDAQERSA